MRSGLQGFERWTGKPKSTERKKEALEKKELAELARLKAKYESNETKEEKTDE